MTYIATFDAGTTAVKGVLVDAQGRMRASASVNIPTLFENDCKEQDPAAWREAFEKISLQFTREVPPEQISGIVMSGQMQDLILLDDALQPVRHAILYSDGRVEGEARQMEQTLGAARLRAITGNACDGSLPLAKLMWVRTHEPACFSRTRHVLISSKDYLIACLTKSCCGDVTACSTAGAMDIHKKCWSAEILTAAELDAALFPVLLASHAQAGGVTPEAAAQFGYRPGTPVYAGVGDAGATTLASGIAEPGQYNINLGTSGWVATVSGDVLQVAEGIFNLAAMPENRYINVVPFLNAGNVHKWISGVLTPRALREQGRIDYEGVAKLLEQSEPGSHGVLFLPYLVGERFPVLDAEAKGCYVGLTPETAPADLARACLEGVAFSVRQGMEQIGCPPKRISVIGGGAREAAWCRILADVLGQPVTVYRDAELLPSLATAAAALLAQGKIQSYAEFTDSLQTDNRCVSYRPCEAHRALYEERYPRYLRLYPALRAMREK